MIEDEFKVSEFHCCLLNYTEHLRQANLVLKWQRFFSFYLSLKSYPHPHPIVPLPVTLSIFPSHNNSYCCLDQIFWCSIKSIIKMLQRAFSCFFLHGQKLSETRNRLMGRQSLIEIFYKQFEKRRSKTTSPKFDALDTHSFWLLNHMQGTYCAAFLCFISNQFLKLYLPSPILSLTQFLTYCIFLGA